MKQFLNTLKLQFINDPLESIFTTVTIVVMMLLVAMLVAQLIEIRETSQDISELKSLIYQPTTNNEILSK